MIREQISPRPRHLFIETPNVNAPAIEAYLRLGLRIVGFDASLYRSTPADGEVAVYLACDITAREIE